MADRTVYGLNYSENGWRMVGQGSCVWVKVPGTNVTLQIREGQPATILGAFAADFNAYVEPLRDGDSACWTATNSVSSSNHLSGTAMDLNWNGPDGKTFRLGISKERAYPGEKSRALDELIAFYEGLIFCGGNWSIKDWMHFQLGANTYGANNVHKVQSFINRKIRSDGFSTFRRNGGPPAPPPPPVSSAADVLARATDITLARAQALQPQVSFALARSNCTNPRRIAAALAQWVIESGHFVYTEEIASGPETQERWKYKGRTWIQLTWLENYLGFSRWCHSLGLVPTPTYFGDHPKLLAEQKWAALGPAYWWAIKYPQINEYADRGDIDNVSKWVNAPAWVGDPNKHANHEKERRDAYNRALALGDQLLTLVSAGPQPPGEDDELSAEAERKIAELHEAFFGPPDFESLSPLRTPGEGKVGNLLEFIRWMDANVHVILELLLVKLSDPDPDAKALLQRVAENTDPKRVRDRNLARAIWNEITAPQATRVVNIQAPLQVEVEPEVLPDLRHQPQPVPSSVVDAADQVIEAFDFAAAFRRRYEQSLGELIGEESTGDHSL